MRSVREIGMLLVSVTALAGCAKVHRYPERKAPQVAAKELSPRILKETFWAETIPQLDVPLVFVSAADPEWTTLPKVWNVTPTAGLGSRTLHLGQHPLAAVVALRASLPREVIKIRVPLGLPDPTPQIPSGNAPTLAKWHLGKDLFHEKMLKVNADILSCADCHRPGHAFADDWSHRVPMTLNSLSLINSVYNRRQFWDGRVEFLEEVLAREPNGSDQEGELAKHHAWPKIGEALRALAQKANYKDRFLDVFGQTRPTPDAAAKALATYVRTLLGGNSLYDQAAKDRQDRKDKSLAAAHLEPLLDEKALGVLSRVGKKRQDVAQEWAQGYELFRGKGQCLACHQGPLFTDHDYHNIGIDSDVSERFAEVRAESGRILHVPVGMKEDRLVGAFRTATLRNLLKSGPYFHDGKQNDLRGVVKYYSDGIFHNHHLPKILLDVNEQPKELRLSLEEMDALVLFLRSLEGEALDPVITGEQPSKK